MRRGPLLAALLLGLTACAVHLDLRVTRVPAEPDAATLRDEVRAVLRDVGLPAGPLDDAEVADLLARLRPEQERARRPLLRLLQRLRH